MPARFELYANNRSAPSYKVGLMLSLCNEPFDFHYIDFMKGDHKSEVHLKRNRYGQVPVLIDNASGRGVVQSALILDILADRLQKFGGANYDERVEIREWLFWTADRLAPPIWRLRAMRLGFRPMTQDVAAMYYGEAQAALEVLDKHLQGRDWLVGGAPSIADIDIYAVLHFTDRAEIDLTPYKNVAAFRQRFRALPGYKDQSAAMPVRTTLVA